MVQVGITVAGFQTADIFSDFYVNIVFQVIGEKTAPFSFLHSGNRERGKIQVNHSLGEYFPEVWGAEHNQTDIAVSPQGQ